MAFRQVLPRKRPKKPVRRIVKDPLAPLSDQQLQQQSLGLVNSQLAPLFAQANTSANARAQQGSQAITQYTSALAGHLGEYADRAKAAYGEAEREQAASSEALRSLLTGAGEKQSAELAGKLSSFGAPAAAQEQVAGGAARDATGAANAGYAQGSNDLQALQAQGANQQGYSNALPGIVALQGLQNVKELQAQVNQQLSEKIGELSATGQQLYVSLYTHFLDNELQKALARQSGQFKNLQVQADAQYKAAQIAFKKTDLAWKNSRAAQAEGGRNARASMTEAGRNSRAARAERARTARAKLTQKGQNQRQNKWQTNPDGSFRLRRNKKTGKTERIPLKPAKGSGGGSGL